METQTISEAKEICNYIAELVLRFTGPFSPLFTSFIFIHINSHHLVIVSADTGRFNALMAELRGKWDLLHRAIILAT